LIVFIDEHRDRSGVELICRVLQIAPSTYWARKRAEREPAARTLADRELLREIRRVHDQSRGLYGVRKVWWQLTRDGIPRPDVRWSA
jgi:putative transposase